MNRRFSSAQCDEMLAIELRKQGKKKQRGNEMKTILHAANNKTIHS
jgi:hypothetical protein